MLAAENFRPIAEAAARIATNKIKIESLARRTVFTDSAYLQIAGIDAIERRWEAQILLKKEGTEWRILFLYLRREEELPPGRKPFVPQTEPLRIVPYFSERLPAEKRLFEMHLSFCNLKPFSIHFRLSSSSSSEYI